MAVISERFDDLGRDGSPVRLGLLGGTFDPIHVGHLSCAEQVRDALGLDAVLFIPAGTPVFKLDRRVTPAPMRLELCRLAVADNPAFDASAIEIERGGRTFTVDTLRQLREHYPANVQFFFITGSDAAATLGKWKDAAAIMRLATVVAASRPGFAFSPNQRAASQGVDLGKVQVVEVPQLEVSSSDIQQRASAGRSIRYLVPEAVRQRIAATGLYAQGGEGR